MKLYLIGNGASIPYGAPLGTQIFTQALDLWYQRIQTQKTDNLFRYIDSNLERILQTIDDLRREVLGNIQSLHIGYNSSKLWIIRHPNSVPKDAHKYFTEIKEYLSQENNFIWNLFPEFVEKANDGKLYGYYCDRQNKCNLLNNYGNTYDTLAEFSFKIIYGLIQNSRLKPKIYESFTKKLKTCSPDGVVIINLNYDTLFEKALEKDVDINLINLTCGEPRLKNGKTNVFLYKPHGSFDMLYCRRCKDVIRAKDFQVLQYTSQDPIDKCSKCRAKRESFFIPYGNLDNHSKASDTQKIFTKHVNAFLLRLPENIIKQEEIITIGYSFSEYNNELVDKHLLPIFKGKKITIVARKSVDGRSIESKLKKFKLNAKDSGYNGFEEYVDHM